MGTIGLLEKALNIRSFNQRVLASNVANVETPGYKEKRIDFLEELGKSGSGTGSSIQVSEVEPPDGVSALDSNSVNVEDQIVKMTENTMLFNSFVQLISKKFSMIKYAIREGR